MKKRVSAAIFCFCFIFGVWLIIDPRVKIFVISMFDIQENSNAFVLPTIVSAVIVLYAGAIASSEKLRSISFNIDALYYVGFLFTLTMMVVTFYVFSNKIVGSAGDDYTKEITELISNNGIALSSTIVGMFLRLIIKMMGQDDAAKLTYIPLTEHEFTEYTKLIAELRRVGEMSGEIAKLGKQIEVTSPIINSLNASLPSLQGQVDKFSPAISDFITHNSESLQVAINLSDELLRALESNKNKYVNAHAVMSDDIAKIVRELAEYIGGVKGDFDAIKETNDALLALYANLNSTLDAKLRTGTGGTNGR